MIPAPEIIRLGYELRQNSPLITLQRKLGRVTIRQFGKRGTSSHTRRHMFE